VVSHSVEPIIMLTAAQNAVEKAVARARLTLSDIGLFEVGEAFAALLVKFQSDPGSILSA
jgi:acetyl-CoA C-acetyltransferase